MSNTEHGSEGLQGLGPQCDDCGAHLRKIEERDATDPWTINVRWECPDCQTAQEDSTDA